MSGIYSLSSFVRSKSPEEAIRLGHRTCGAPRDNLDQGRVAVNSLEGIFDRSGQKRSAIAQKARKTNHPVIVRI
jgi:hypothetical protein